MYPTPSYIGAPGSPETTAGPGCLRGLVFYGQVKGEKRCVITACFVLYRPPQRTPPFCSLQPPPFPSNTPPLLFLATPPKEHPPPCSLQPPPPNKPPPGSCQGTASPAPRSVTTPPLSGRSPTLYTQYSHAHSTRPLPTLHFIRLPTLPTSTQYTPQSTLYTLIPSTTLGIEWGAMVFFTFIPKVNPAAYGHSRLSVVHINAVYVYVLNFRCPCYSRGLQGP